MRVPVDLVNEAVLQAIEEHALTPEAIQAVIHVTETADARRQQDAASDELRDVEKRIARLLEAIEAGGDAASLVGRLKELEARKAGLADRIAALRPVPRLATDVVQERLDEWRRLLRGSVTQGRAVLKRILDGRITFTPREDGGLDFECPTVYHRLFAGYAVARPVVAGQRDRHRAHYAGGHGGRRPWAAVAARLTRVRPRKTMKKPRRVFVPSGGGSAVWITLRSFATAP